MEGASRGESVLYVTLSETEEELRAVSDSHGWNLDGVDDPRARAGRGRARSRRAEHDVPSLRGGAGATTTQLILADVERLKPARVVFDSLSELRLLAGNALRYRRQILALKQFFATRDCTVRAARRHDGDRPRPADAEHRARRGPARAAEPRVRRRAAPAAGREVPRRAVSRRIPRLRRSISGGLQVFPRLVAAEHRQAEHPRQAAAATSPSSTRCWAVASRRARAR